MALARQLGSFGTPERVEPRFAGEALAFDPRFGRLTLVWPRPGRETLAATRSRP